MTIEDTGTQTGGEDVRESGDANLNDNNQLNGDQGDDPDGKPAGEGDPGADKEGNGKSKDGEDDDHGKSGKNRTGKYIRSLQQRLSEAAQREQEYQQRLEALEKRIGPDKSDVEPTLEAYDYDFEAFTKAHSKWATRQALEERDQTREQSKGQEEMRQTVASYNDKLAAFVEDHPDFVEAIESMPYTLTQAQQLAIMRHENGPAIAYHLANHDDDAFQLASVRDELASGAVDRLASRLSAAQKAQTNTRPTTQAPDPPPKVSGRSKSEPDPTKLTDDDWYRRNKRK